jgi:hypothetical protein
MGSSYDGPEALVEEELAGVEEAREDALEVAQEADAPPQARAEVAEAVRPRSPPDRAGENYIRTRRIRTPQGDVG